ncbi:MAG: sulfotransferase family protein [Thermodesulfobacteriota bacterium]
MAALFQQTITGMNIKTLGTVLWRHREQIDWCYFPRLAYLAVLAGFNSYTGLLEKAVDGAKIVAAEPVAPPIIILGYWRSGTTHLHNLLNCDPGFACPTAYQVMFPHHFVYSRPWGASLFDHLAPSKRPMDNVAFHGTTPHEEEVALAGLTGVSPYLRILFPAPAQDPYAALDPAQLPPEALAAWQDAFRLFMQKLSFSTGKQIVLKSPPHLGRIPVLLELFPGAKFVHIVRNPYEVYLSFWRVWRVGHEPSHLQKPDYDFIDELILSWYEELFALFERDRDLIPAGDLHELHFEDLVASPEKSLAGIYQGLSLPDFDRFWAQASPYLASIADYKKSSYRVTEEVRAKVNQRWGFFFQRYGYPLLPPLTTGASVSMG